MRPVGRSALYSLPTPGSPCQSGRSRQLRTPRGRWEVGVALDAASVLSGSSIIGTASRGGESRAGQLTQSPENFTNRALAERLSAHHDPAGAHFGTCQFG